MHDEEGAPQRPDQSPQQPAPEGAIAPEISRRVGSILDAVETEAARLREETHQEAARYLDEVRRYADGLVIERRRRIAELSDELVSKSEAVVARLDDAVPVRQGFENLVRALGDAAERLARETEGSSQAFEPPPYGERRPEYAQAQPPPHAQPEPPLQYQPQPPPQYQPPAEAGWRGLDEARMVAIQMAAGGSTRGVVREHLHRSLGVPEASGILDEVFGAGTAEGDRVPWTAGPR